MSSIVRTLKILTLCHLIGVLASPLAIAQGALPDIPQGDVVIGLEEVAAGLSSPLQVTHAGDGSGRLFIVEQTGQIRIVEDGVLLPDPFLDISGFLPDLGEFFDERGLLGLAFHPDYANNGRFFVRYSSPRAGDPAQPCNDPNGFIVGCHAEVLAEYAVSEDPNVADDTSGRIVFSADQPQFNHDGGHVAFGPDGFIYFGLGDGGGAHDGLADDPISPGPIGHGQDINTPLGAMIRLDVDGALPYEVPLDNPFVGEDGLDEIYAWGFRNPYRFSFDRGGSNELFVGDVGQALIEEVDVVVNGGNYGWVIREGAHCFDPLNPETFPPTCDTTDLIDPIAEYDHDDGLSVIGGYVYRGSQYPELEGLYIFGEFSTDFVETLGRIFYLDAEGDRSAIFEFQNGNDNAPIGLFGKGMGEDEDGEVYFTGSTVLGPFGDGGGVVLRVTGSSKHIPGDCDGNGSIGMNDATCLLELIFLGTGTTPPCGDGSPTNSGSALIFDWNGDGEADMSDAIALLRWDLLGGPSHALSDGGPPSCTSIPGCSLAGDSCNE